MGIHSWQRLLEQFLGPWYGHEHMPALAQHQAQIETESLGEGIQFMVSSPVDTAAARKTRGMPGSPRPYAWGLHP
jgi:hypothetical protein